MFESWNHNSPSGDISNWNYTFVTNCSLFSVRTEFWWHYFLCIMLLSISHVFIHVSCVVCSMHCAFHGQCDANNGVTMIIIAIELGLCLPDLFRLLFSSSFFFLFFFLISILKCTMAWHFVLNVLNGMQLSSIPMPFVCDFNSIKLRFY